MPRPTAEILLTRWLAIARWPLLVALFGAFAALGGASAAEVSLVHIDGAYQTISMLRHMDAGRWPGRDFLPYLGVGIPSVLWPFYRLAGGTLWASQATATFAGLAATFAGGALLSGLTLRAIGVRRAYWLAIAGGALATTLALPSPPNVHSLILPGNSLYSLRSAAAYLVAGLVLLAARRGRWSVPISASGTSVLLLWSNDYAFTSALALHVALIAHFAGRMPIARLAGVAAASLFAGVLLYLVLLTLATAGSPAALWQFNLFAIAADQHWYYPPYGRYEHYFVPLDLLGYWRRHDDWLSAVLLLTPFFAIGCLARRLRRRVPMIALAAALWTAFASGLLSEIGGHKNPGYHQMTAQVLPFTMIAALACATHWPIDLRLRMRALLQRVRLPLEASIAVSIMVCIGAMLGVSSTHVAHLRADPQFRFDSSLDGFVPSSYAEELERLKAAVLPQGLGATATSAYLSPYGVILQHRQVPPVDTVIHALGYLRQPFIASLRAPTTRYAVTTNGRSTRRVDAHLAQWGTHQDWGYFGTLARYFQPKFIGSRTVLWERRASPALASQSRRCAISQGRMSANLRVEGQLPGTAYELAIRYRLQCDGALVSRRAIVVGHAPYDSDVFSGRYSLPPPRPGVVASANLLHVPHYHDRETWLNSAPGHHCYVIVTDCQAKTLPHIDRRIAGVFGVVAPYLPALAE